MKIITVTHDGKINSGGFKTYEEARLFVVSRIPENAFVRTDRVHPYANPDYWVKLEYVEVGKEGFGRIHTWELNEITVVSSKSS